MDDNVYTPGAGHRPPVLAGRDHLVQGWTLTLNDLASRGRVGARDLILTGPRGVGKTAAMSTLAEVARDQGFEEISLQAVVGGSGLVQSLVQTAARRLSDHSAPWARARQAFERFAGLSLGVAGASMSVSAHAPAGTVEPADVDAASLAAALDSLGMEVCRDRPNGGVLLTLDEMQVASSADLALLAAAMHRLNVAHPDAKVCFIATALPHILSVLTQAGVTHPDRLFLLERFATSLTADDAAYAIVEPARRRGVRWEPHAVETIVEESNGYPAHLQLFAAGAWQAAAGRTITAEDARLGVTRGAARISSQSWEPTWDRLADREIEYLAALAIENGASSTTRLASLLSSTAADLAQVRHRLLGDGLIYAPRRNRLVLTEPLFAAFVLRHYEATRADSHLPLTSVDKMRERQSALGHDAN